MADSPTLFNLGLCVLTASLGLPLAVVLGYHPAAGWAVGLALTLLPFILLSPFARDLGEDSRYDPNLAALLFNAHEQVCTLGGMLGFVAMLLCPLAIGMGFDPRPGAIFILVGTAICGARKRGQVRARKRGQVRYWQAGQVSVDKRLPVLPISDLSRFPFRFPFQSQPRWETQTLGGTPGWNATRHFSLFLRNPAIFL